MSGYPISLSALSVSAGKSLPHGLTELRGTNFTDGTSSPASGTIRFLDFLNKSIGNTPPTVYPAHLRASSPIDNDQLGSSISISGNYAIAGAEFADPGGRSSAGAAYIFERTPTSWVQRAILIPSDSTAGDYFGTSVSISGDYAIIGARSAHPGGVNNAGAAYIFVRSGTNWSQQMKIVASDKAAYDYFGGSVSISPTHAIIGASSADPNGLSAAGAAYIFARSGSYWYQQAKLVASDKARYDSFGSGVSISGDYVIVGAYREDPSGVSNAGSAYIFVRSGTLWPQQAKLVSSDKATSDQFGRNVSISGGFAIVGAGFADPNGVNNAGAAYVFVRSGTTWSQQAKLVANDKAASDIFGESVAISSTGYAIVGASSADPNGISGGGAAYIFKRSGSSWSQETKLISPNIGSGDYFGRSVSIDGDRAVASAPREYVNSIRGGAGHVFKRNANGTWSNLTG
tara:strand:- start:3879 stop:5252 length:1374 start_codon:yes stop_codon:yes gene_type:complete